MLAADIERGVGAASAIAVEHGLAVDDVAVLHDSNVLTVRLQPCDVVSRIAPRGQEDAAFQVELAQRLTEVGAPVAALDPRIAAGPHERDGFVVTFWTFYESGPTEPAVVADGLRRLHAGMRQLDHVAPHVTDRMAQAQRIVADPHRSPELVDADRALLGDMLRDLRRAIVGSGTAEQPIHGEPHPGNILSAVDGVRFIDLQTCCEGPIELDVAHLPEAVADCYPELDQDLLGHCRGLVIALVAAWRWEASDELPDGRRARHDLLDTLRAGPPWPVLAVVVPSAEEP